MILKQDNTLWVTGANMFGQLGIGSKSSTTATYFVEVFRGTVKGMSAGGGHSMVLKQDGSVWSAGMNTYGQLGDGSRTAKSTFVRALPLCHGALPGYEVYIFCRVRYNKM